MSKFVIDKFTGNNFILSFGEMPFMKDLLKSRNFSLFVTNVGIPGLSLEKNMKEWQGKYINTIDGNIVFEDLQVTFDIDAEFLNWGIIFEWMNKITNNDDVVLETLKKYSIDATLTVYSTFNTPIMQVTYLNVFPYIMEDVTLSTREGEPYLETNVTFAYDKYKIKFINN